MRADITRGNLVRDEAFIHPDPEPSQGWKASPANREVVEPSLGVFYAGEEVYL